MCRLDLAQSTADKWAVSFTEGRRLEHRFIERITGRTVPPERSPDMGISRIDVTPMTSVQNLYIRGTGRGKWPFVEYFAPNHVANAAVHWLLQTRITPEMVIFSGAFTRRQLREDGSLIPDEEWKAINTPLSKMDKDEEEEEEEDEEEDEEDNQDEI